MFGLDTFQDSTPQMSAALSVPGQAAEALSGHGLISGTRIASTLGWRAVEAIAPGDKVLTFDNGMQIVTDVRRTTLRTGAQTSTTGAAPVLVPTGALGNRVPLTLLPEQAVMVESDAASDAQGDPFALLPASALRDYRGITSVAGSHEFEVTTLYFAQPQVIYAEAGTLIYCPAALLDLLDLAAPPAQIYDVLNTQDAAALVQCMHYEDLSSGYCPTGTSAAYAA